MTMRFKISSSLLATACAGLALTLAGGVLLADQSAAPAAASSVAEPKTAGGPLVMRRLTESQYRATIADVFAPDVPIAGRFERGLRQHGLIAVGTSMGGMSAFSFEQYDASARSIAATVTSEKRRAQFVPCQPKSATAFDRACAAQFVDTYGLKLFRRPLARDERDRFVGVARGAQQRLGGFYQGLEYALVGMLQSPHFLLRMERAEPDPGTKSAVRLDAWSKATRLSYFLTNSAPDAELLRAAAAGELHSEQGLARQVDRLIASPRLESAVRAFFWDMLQFDGFNDLFKDPAIYPTYNSAVAADAQEQTLRTIVSHLVTERGDYRELFTTRTTWLTRPLGIVYRLPVATRNGWETAEYPANSNRSGILTDVSMLALYSHPGRSSATLRGKSLREVFLCQPVPDPPANVNFTSVNETERPGSTARMRLAEHNENPACKGCHALTDPIGLTLENFDGAGGFRARENGVDLDLSGSLDGTDFAGSRGLGQAMHDNPAVPLCLADKLYRFAVGRDLAEGEDPYVEYLMTRFAAEGYRVPNLLRTIALSKTFFAVAPPALQTPAKVTAALKGDRS
jgi:hypothetical protein